MPGYPRVDQASDHLIARFDGAVLDGKPWGRGALDEVPPTAEALGHQDQQATVLSHLHSLEVSQPHQWNVYRMGLYYSHLSVSQSKLIGRSSACSSILCRCA